MAYAPIGPADRKRMLAAIGVDRVEDLFTSIPAPFRLDRNLDLPAAHSEPELRRRFDALGAGNRTVQDGPCFLGAGAYRHYVPSVVPHLLGRSEFYSAYTPYQAEVSQGTLQAIFEYQSMICQLTGMEVANASLYDGASAVAEAALLALRVQPGRRILLADNLHPHYREVTRTYCRHLDVRFESIPFDDTGRVDPDRLAERIDAETAVVVLQSPNFFGVVEDLAPLAERCHAAGVLLAVAVADPVALGLLQPPGVHGADLVVGEAQGFGGGLQFGGPNLGFLAIRNQHLRELPGRLVGRARDGDGRDGYVLTLATREQHIRRSKATSNICTNQGLCALAATVFLASLGRRGLRDMARHCLHKAHYARQRLARLPGCRVLFSGPMFHEFALELPEDAGVIAARLAARGLLAGLPLGPYYPDLHRALLVCVTEVNRREEIDALAAALEEEL